jgi:superfamily II DNA or RNA helicase
VQSLRSAKRRAQIRNVGLIIVDECHHATAATYRAILMDYGALPFAGGVTYRKHGMPASVSGRAFCQVAGFTATLARGDKAKLSDIWQECTFQRGIAFGIRRGYLLDVRGKRIVVPDLDLSTVKKSGGDYQDASLGSAMDAALAPSVIASAYLEHAKGRKGLAFWPLVDTAFHGADAFNEAGIPSAVVHGGTPREERRLILKKLHTGEIQVVHNCGVLTEGFDEPTVSCVVNARPTQSAPLYQQMVGRGLRPDLSLPPENRGDCLVLDVVGVSRTHNLRTLIDLSERAPDDFEMDEDQTFLELEDEVDAMLRELEEDGMPSENAEYVGIVAAEDFDPLARAGIGAWLRTAGGTYFLPLGKEIYLLLVESEEPGRYDVAWLTQSAVNSWFTDCAGMDPYIQPSRACVCGGGHTGSQGDLTEHQGMALDMATSWAEELLEDWGGSTALVLAGTKKRWRREEPSGAQKDWCERNGIDWSQMRKGEVSDLMSTTFASRRIDPVVAFMKAARG